MCAKITFKRNDNYFVKKERVSLLRYWNETKAENTIWNEEKHNLRISKCTWASKKIVTIKVYEIKSKQNFWKKKAIKSC